MTAPAKTKTIFIDMDGTIVDSHPLLLEAYLDFMRQMGKTGSQEEFQELVGPTICEVVAILHKRYAMKDSVDELAKKYCRILEQIYQKKLQLFDGVVEFLEYAKQKGIGLILVTSANSCLAESLLQTKNIRPYFDCIVSAEGGKGKPAPDVYLKALKIAMCNVDEAAVIEDSSSGVQASVRAGIFTLHIFDAPLPPPLKNHPLVTHVKDWRIALKWLLV